MRNVIAASPLHYANISALLSACGRVADLRLGSALHAAVLKQAAPLTSDKPTDLLRDVVVLWNSLISMYFRCCRMPDAAKVFDDMDCKDTVSWNSIVSGSLRRGDLHSGFRFLREMRRSDSCPFDHATMTTVLSALAEPELLYAVGMVHSVVVVSGHGREASVGNVLVTAYFKCGAAAMAREVFEEMNERNVITWTAMISGLAQSEHWRESLSLFLEMRRSVQANSLTYSSSLTACSGIRALHEGRQIHSLVMKSGLQHDPCTESALMDMYSKCGVIDDACCIFESAREEPDQVSYTVILAGFAQNGLEEKALDLFTKMVGAGMEIDADITSAVLGAFGSFASFALGRQIHSMVTKKCFSSNVFVCNGLINMYSKCGELGDSVRVFDQMLQKNSVSWNSMIAAFARHGLGFEALQLYESMRSQGVEPTDVTFLSLLHSCSHVGEIQKGLEFLQTMTSVHGIIPRTEHYACVVDMLGRASRLEEARKLIDDLPVEPNALIWQSLLGVCGIHHNMELGKDAAYQLLQLAPGCSAAYVLLANISSAGGAWKDRARIVKKMKDMGVRKETAMSWIEIAGSVHRFVVDGRAHEQAEAIYKVLEELCVLCGDKGDMAHENCLI